jgi:hypothetical protein
MTPGAPGDVVEVEPELGPGACHHRAHEAVFRRLVEAGVAVEGAQHPRQGGVDEVLRSQGVAPAVPDGAEASVQSRCGGLLSLGFDGGEGLAEGRNGGLGRRGGLGSQLLQDAPQGGRAEVGEGNLVDVVGLDVEGDAGDEAQPLRDGGNLGPGCQFAGCCGRRGERSGLRVAKPEKRRQPSRGVSH